MSFLPLNRRTKESDLNLAKKSNSRKNVVTTTNFKVTGNSLLDKIKSINANVAREFKDQEHKYKLILDRDMLAYYIDKANKIGELVLDTETTSLDPITCTLAGVGLYVPDLIPSYTPLNHVSYVTGVRIKEQLNNEIMKEQLLRLKKDTKLIFHNCKYDIRVILNKLGINLFPFLWWDTMLASPLLDENEPHDLKYLHSQYCSGDNKKFKELFQDVPFTYIPINSAYYYGAKDTLLTYELYKFQQPYLTSDHEVCKSFNLERIADYYQDIELPSVLALIEMEENGISVDKEYAESLLSELENDLEKSEEGFSNACLEYAKDIKKYRLQNTQNCKLNDPIKISSPDQIAILLYDIIKLEAIDRQNPRGTGVEILKTIIKPENEYSKGVVDIVEFVLEYRKISKLISTYVKKLPKEVKKETGKIHTVFNQHIAVTGRLSSEDPNLQNIPKRGEKGAKVRLMFISDSLDDCLIFCDYSQQEPRILAYLSQDEKLIELYEKDNDLYATMGSFTFRITYDEALKNKKMYREPMKPVILGVMYDRTAHTIAEDLNISVKDAQSMLDSFYNSFQGVEQFREESIEFSKENGYILMLCGRKRRIPDMKLSKYSFIKYSEGNNFDALSGLDDDDDNSLEENFLDEVDEETINLYWKALDKAWGWKQKQAIIAKASEEGIKIEDNSLRISEATRQVVNSKIQGSAAVMTKNALVKFKAVDIYQLQGRRKDFYKKLESYLNISKQIKEMGGKLKLQVHDELGIGAPKKNAKQLKDLLCEIMVRSAEDLIKQETLEYNKGFSNVPIKVDAKIVERWNGEVINV